MCYLLIAWTTGRVCSCWGNCIGAQHLSVCCAWRVAVFSREEMVAQGIAKSKFCKISKAPSTNKFLFRMHLSSADCKTEVYWYSWDAGFEWSAAIPWYALQQLAISFLPVHINQINKASRGKSFLSPVWWCFDIQFPTVSTYDSYLLEAC